MYWNLRLYQNIFYLDNSKEVINKPSSHFEPVSLNGNVLITDKRNEKVLFSYDESDSKCKQSKNGY